jgi:D-lactate dehydrogenase
MATVLNDPNEATGPAAALAPEPGPSAPDRAPDWVADGTPEPLRSELIALLGEDRVLTRASDIVRYASDASPYRYFPKAIVMAHDADDVAKTMRFGREMGVPVVFRAGGSSLNGQSQGDGILIDVRRHFGGIEVLDDGRAASIAPGVILGHANRVLEPYGYRLGPDPASTEIATVGGVVANNSGGMRCGTTQDSYSTVTGMTFVTPSGTVIDTTAPGAGEEFEASEPELARGLMEIREEILADPDLADLIRRKFEIKNTIGYRLCAFLHAETPMEIFRRLIVGSEGTLAFIARVRYETVPVPRKTTLAWMHFPDIASATAPVQDLVAAGASAVELMVAPALITASWNMPGAPEHWKELDPASAALLVEFGGPDDAALDEAEKRAFGVIDGHELIRDVEFSRDEETVEINWRVREGLHGLIGKIRPAGTSLIVEDVCVRPARIAEAAEEIRALLGKHEFLPGVAGHASVGNLHFMLTPDFGQEKDLERYEAFMDDLVDLICSKYEGSLKAEHGTGMNMAPYVEKEWGEKAVSLMWRIKELADPDGLLGPGVVLNRDPDCHLKNLKTTPQASETVDSCVECGFCEPVCPSRNLTTTPRQRIVLRREMVRQGGDGPVLRALLDEFEYDSLQTCAADGSCQMSCPVGIDTGAFVKEFRRQQKTPAQEKRALRAAKKWASVERLARGGLRVASALSRVVGDGGVRDLSRAARAVGGDELVPEWGEGIPGPAGPHLPQTSREEAAAVYLPACINRIFGRPDGAPGDLSVPEALVAVSARAGKPVWIPDDVAGTCCSVPFSSKGFADAHRFKANETVEKLWRWTDEGRLPVVMDASSCSHGLTEFGEGVLTEENATRHTEIEILDSVVWAERHLLDGLEVSSPVPSVTLHPTCSGRQMGLDWSLERVAGAIADQVAVPAGANCCGFAGDRGMLHPELTASATAEEAAEVGEAPTDRYASTNRTCEIGMQRATGETYESLIGLLEEATRD